jgi:hypothetical protein
MKTPRSRKAGAFQMLAFANTSRVEMNATSAPYKSTPTERRFRWDTRSNSIEPLTRRRWFDV